MKEKNKQYLEQAIEKLPAYEPPAFVWDKISAQMDTSDKDRTWHEAIGQMRTYEPPASVWHQIQWSLDNEKNASGHTRRLYLYLRMATAAAAVALLILAFNFWSRHQPAPSVAYTIEEKTIPAAAEFTADWNADEDLIDEVITLFEESPKANTSSSFQTLREELSELNEAKEELEMLMEKYGKDAGTIQELKEIELERSDVIKQMASLI